MIPSPASRCTEGSWRDPIVISGLCVKRKYAKSSAKCDAGTSWRKGYTRKGHCVKARKKVLKVHQKAAKKDAKHKARAVKKTVHKVAKKAISALEMLQVLKERAEQQALDAMHKARTVKKTTTTRKVSKKGTSALDMLRLLKERAEDQARDALDARDARMNGDVWSSTPRVDMEGQEALDALRMPSQKTPKALTAAQRRKVSKKCTKYNIKSKVTQCINELVVPALDRFQEENVDWGDFDVDNDGLSNMVMEAISHQDDVSDCARKKFEGKCAPPADLEGMQDEYIVPRLTAEGDRRMVQVLKEARDVDRREQMHEVYLGGLSEVPPLELVEKRLPGMASDYKIALETIENNPELDYDDSTKKRWPTNQLRAKVNFVSIIAHSTPDDIKDSLDERRRLKESRAADRRLEKRLGKATKRLR
jgi:hypothetical protein